MPLEDALDGRKSVRSFAGRTLTRKEVSQILWAAQGEAAGGEVAAETGATRRAPSAGALYPLEVFLLEGETLSSYEPGSHSLVPVSEGIDLEDLADASLGQSFIFRAPAVFVIAADFERTRRKYGDRAERYVWMEAGHAAQNLLLEATALGLGSVPVGAFDDEGVARALGLPQGLSSLYIIPVGQ